MGAAEVEMAVNDADLTHGELAVSEHAFRPAERL